MAAGMNQFNPKIGFKIMTGATAMATPYFSVENQVADGTLKDAIFQLSKNQCDLNLMFKKVVSLK